MHIFSSSSVHKVRFYYFFPLFLCVNKIEFLIFAFLLITIQDKFILFYYYYWNIFDITLFILMIILFIIFILLFWLILQNIEFVR